ncbi:hypothetical protein P3T21_007691 [Paraburkholderia sp. GAS334]|jgi:hypothetical protein
MTSNVVVAIASDAVAALSTNSSGTLRPLLIEVAL